MCWVHLAQNSDHLQVPLNTVIKFWVPQKAVIFKIIYTYM